MERCVGACEAEVLRPDQSIVEFSSPGAETGLEEPMWRVRLDEGSGSYPGQPEKPYCISYLRTGFCGYGPRCRFIHPPDRNSVVRTGKRGEEYPEREGQPLCKFFMKTGSCKFNSTCRYHHPRREGGPSGPSLNYFGYPLRLGEKECSYYMRTGKCKFGGSCKFHHPQPPAPIPAAVDPMPQPALLYPPLPSPSVPNQQYGILAFPWQVSRPPIIPVPYAQGPHGHILLPPAMVSGAGWSPYQVSSGFAAAPDTGSNLFYGSNWSSPSAPTFAGSYSPMPYPVGPLGNLQKEKMFPERPGQPECQHYIKTGDCKFGSLCRYHHPPEWNALNSDVDFSPMGLPMRPGAPTCVQYTKHGKCRFGHTCKYDHPAGTLIYSPSASSLAGMPIAPYPSELSMGTELVLGSRPSSIRKISASMSSGSVSSMLSESAAVSHSGIEQSVQNSAPSIGSDAATPEGEAEATN